MDGRRYRIIFHIIVAVFFFIAWKGVLELGDKVGHLGTIPKRLETRFLTNWNFGMQTVLFFCYLFFDFVELIGFETQLFKKLKRTTDFYFYGINAPTSIFVAVVFWGMCYYDKLLIFPVGLDTIMPDWVNHAIHTVIVPNVILQAYFNKVSYSQYGKFMTASAAYYFLYFVCIYGTFFETNVWVYPFLGKVVEPYRALVLLGLFLIYSVISITFYLTNNWYCNKCATSLPPTKPQRATNRKKQK